MHRLKLNGMQRLYDEMEHIEKPFVVAHQGTRVGGGLELSLSCDFRLAAKSARYSFPEGKRGLLARIQRRQSAGAYRGRSLGPLSGDGNLVADADKAYVMGLVHEVWPDEGFDDRAMDFCRHLARQNGEQMGTAKIAIEMTRDLGPEMGRHVERMANSALMLASDYQAGMRRHLANIGKGAGGRLAHFQAKRTPVRVKKTRRTKT